MSNPIRRNRHFLALLLPIALGVTHGTTGASASATDTDDLRFTGRVTDAHTGGPLSGVQVHIDGSSVGGLTDGDGRYAFDASGVTVAASEIRIVAHLLGYQRALRVVRPVDHLSAGEVGVDFTLLPTPIALQEMVVTGATRSGNDAVSRPFVAFSTSPPHGEAGRARYRPPHEREQYAYIAENRFRSAADHPLSTFSIDVDRASYANVRRFLLRESRLPPVDAVQIEELVNYFPYAYERPENGDPLAVTTELGRAPWHEHNLLLRVGLASPSIDTRDLPASNLVFLIDVSGSMSSPDKLPLVKRSLRLLVEQLRDQDRVALVVYAGAAGVVLDPTSGADKERILDAIERLHAGGSTAGGAGLRLAYAVARKHFVRGGNNRVILATDGDFNVGESSDGAMIRLVEEKRDEGTYLTVLGFGTGNLQATKMQSIAQHGNGNFAYIDRLDEARKVLVGEMGGTLVAVARDVKIQVEFNPERVRSYRLLGYENRLLADEDFTDDQKDAGEMGAGHTVTALYEIVPVGSPDEAGTPRVDPLRYQDEPHVDDPTHGTELAFVKVRYKRPDEERSQLVTKPVRAEAGEPSTDLAFASAVAGFGMLLRDSEHRGTLTAHDVLRLAAAGIGEDPGGYRHGFVELVHAYMGLTHATDAGAR
jgi:Ca-activated chloride channel homolog